MIRVILNKYLKMHNITFLIVNLLHTWLYIEALYYVFVVIKIKSIINGLRNPAQIFHFFFNHATKDAPPQT